MTSSANLYFYNLPWRALPGALPEDEEIFVIGDVHGEADLLNAALSSIAAVTRSTNKRRLVFLGDLIDRGTSSIPAVNLAMAGRKHALADDLCILPGNHDLMLLDAMKDEGSLEHWLTNGGKSVLAELGLSHQKDAWPAIKDSVRTALHPDYLDQIANGPTYLHLGDLLFVHAGIDPHADRPTFLAQSRHHVRSDMHWATIRYPFLNWAEGWDDADQDPERCRQKPTVVVHGHTPSLREPLTDAGKLEICDGIDEYRAVDLDIGAGHRRQLAWAHFTTENGCSQMQIHAVVKPESAR
ncbi:metallophosphoesterase [Pseudorhodobacter sp.]|uniref:metallophosphoesterase n=1 Tax=Pseudorhodobacter sp. TaxID=1934400 RepID=UPI0039E2629D